MFDFSAVRAQDLFDSLNAERAWERVDEDSGYHLDYRYLLRFAETVSDGCLTASPQILAFATYGWMPRIIRNFDLSRTGVEEPIAAIKQVNNRVDALGFIQSIDRIAPVNNSWIGTSKFLHFLNPRFFPIWDSRVAEFFVDSTQFQKRGNNKKHGLHIFANTQENYLKYSDFVLRQQERSFDWTADLAKKFEAKWNYLPSEVRCMELMLFFRPTVGMEVDISQSE